MHGLQCTVYDVQCMVHGLRKGTCPACGNAILRYDLSVYYLVSCTHLWHFDSQRDLNVDFSEELRINFMRPTMTSRIALSVQSQTCALRSQYIPCHVFFSMLKFEFQYKLV